MLTYDTLVKQAFEALPFFRERFDAEAEKGFIDADDGKHIIFGLVFTPMLEELIRESTQPELKQTLDFLELMASAEDGHIVEVCDQSVLEVLNCDFDEKTLRRLLHGKTLEGYEAVKTYML